MLSLQDQFETSHAWRALTRVACLCNRAVFVAGQEDINPMDMLVNIDGWRLPHVTLLCGVG